MILFMFIPARLPLETRSVKSIHKAILVTSGSLELAASISVGGGGIGGGGQRSDQGNKYIKINSKIKKNDIFEFQAIVIP